MVDWWNHLDDLSFLELNLLSKSPRGETPLYHVVVEDRLDLLIPILSLMKKHGVTIANATNSKHVNAFHIATKNIEAMKILFQHEPSIIDSVTNQCATAFHYAASNNQVEVMQWLLDNGSQSINASDINLRTPMYYAIIGNHTEAVSFLAHKDPNLLKRIGASDSFALHFDLDRLRALVYPCCIES